MTSEQQERDQWEHQEREQRERLHSETRRDLLDRQLSNSENYDKAILSLSTGFLGISLAFIKDVIPLPEAAHTWVLITSWILFGVAILLVLASFTLSQSGINKQLVYAYLYYIKRKDKYGTKRSCEAKAVGWVNAAAGIAFSFAIACTVLFVSINVAGDLDMSQDKPGSKQQINEGASIPQMQKVTVVNSGGTRGQEIPAMQPVQTPTSSGQGGQNQGGQSNQESGGGQEND